MADVDLEAKLDAVLEELRNIRRGQSRPAVLTKKAAARELSISLRKLQVLIKLGLIGTCEVGDTRMIPAVEIERIARPSTPIQARRNGGRRKAAASFNPEAEAAALRKRGRAV